jgi:hypothetical protein
MITGIEAFRQWFRGYEDQYVLIGGTACDLLMNEQGLPFRATKDIDMVLMVEALTPEFGMQFWSYVQAAGYEHRNKSTGLPQFYRFSHPAKAGYPYMIELFSRRLDAIRLPADAVLTPLPMEDDVSSLSAILLDDAYYALLRAGKVEADYVPVLDAAYLIPFKAKAWMDLSAKKAAGEHIDSKNIRKHKNDVFRLSSLLQPGQKVVVSQTVFEDMQNFIAAMDAESLDTKQLGLARTKHEILQTFQEIYALGT